MNKYHQEILKEIKKRASHRKGENDFNLPKYLGHQHKLYDLTTPGKREIAERWVQAHKNISNNELVDFLDSLYQGNSYEEKALAGLLLAYTPKLRQELDLKYLDKWLKELVGWAEIDATCQGGFTAKDLLSRWSDWSKFLIQLSKSNYISHRRASLVLLTRAVRESSDPRLAKLAFQNITRLKYEKDILITKAVSWLLRELIKNHPRLVRQYLKENEKGLPRVAVRETRRKLTTGKK